jgi:hypothetical protein
MKQARTLVPFLMTAAVLASPLAASGAAGSASGARGQPGGIFKSGDDKCKLASVAAISKAAGERYTKGSFDGKTCTWSSADGNYVIVVDSHPSGYVELMVPSIGNHPGGEQVRAVGVAGASKAVLDTHPYAKTHRYQKDLYAVYPQGVVQVSLDYATKLPDSALFAVLRLVAHP